MRRARSDQPLREEPLSTREQEVGKLIAEGHSSRQIAEAFVISEKRVERDRANTLEKLGMHDRLQLTRYAIRRGLVEPVATITLVQARAARVPALRTTADDRPAPLLRNNNHVRVL